MGVRDTLERKAKSTIINTGVELLEKNPEKNVEKIFSLLKKGMKDEFAKERVQHIYEYYQNNEVTKEFIQDILKNTNKNSLKKFFCNFFGNATWYGIPKRAAVGEENDTKVPFTILISPTMRCNLRCTGCYAANYTREDDLPQEEVERLIGEARDMGIYYVVVLGGETFINKGMLDIYEKYNDMMFMPFTNGTLIDEKTADKLAELGNVMPMLSIEGWPEDTDARRGDGIFNKVIHAMEILNAKGVPFGASSATSNSNMDTVTSEKFIDMLVDKGARMIWYFMFMPVGEDPIGDMKYMLTPEERIELGRRTRKIRTTKKIFTIDFFNDAPYVGGCIAGKYYCHINSKGDVEPCIFSHYAVENVKHKPLIEAFKADFFKEIRERQPYSKNLLRPCMMIDNPNEMREIAAKTKAYPTHESARLMLESKEFQDRLNKLAEDFKPIADEAFEKDFNGTGNYHMSKG